MKPFFLLPKIVAIALIVLLIFGGDVFATHAQSADITYQCLGGNQYEIKVSFYRDCAGAAAPNTVTVNLASASCNRNFNATLNRIPGTGIDVTQVCNTITTQCNGGTYPGVQEFIYRAVVTLPAQCVDWVFSFSLCCRNNAINTINNPGGDNIYVAAQLNNLNFPCNSSPTFTNPPVSYPCIGQTSCFNHGAVEADGDSLYYSLLTPATGPTTTVNYNGGFSATQPLTSNPLITFNPITGDICFSPTMLQVTVLAVKVEEWRNGVFVGSVIRDIQLRTVLCNNTVPTVSGINGTGQFSIYACVGSNLSFTVPAQDIDAGQTVSINWNAAISGATFTSNNLQIPTGTFSWTPSAADISSIPRCFTVTVRDNNCPLNGVQVYAFCVTVSSLNITTNATSANCGASNGSATVTVLNGTGPYTYQWLPNGGNNATANGLQAGTYTVNVTDALGCSRSQNVIIGSGAANGNINVVGTNVSCSYGTNGSATVNVNGGQQPYTYQWSNGATTQTVQNLSAGTYQVNVTTANGCLTSSSVTITQPSTPLSVSSISNPVSCFGGNNGSGSILATGGTAPYTYSWNTTPVQTTASANNLIANNYLVTITDSKGCIATEEISITEPTAFTLSLGNQQNISCNGGANGSLNVVAAGGVTPYQYTWNGGALPNSANLSNLNAGNYNLVLIDANGCRQTANYVLTQPVALSSAISNQSNVSCNGFMNGSISMNIQGGTLPYSLQWNNGATTANLNNIGQGNYTLNVTDANGCLSTVSATIIQPSAPLSSSVTPTPVSCFGGNNGVVSTLVSGGTAPYIYNWSDFPTQNVATVSNLVANSYAVTITDANGCTTINSSIVTQPSALTLNLNNLQNINCNGLGNGSIAVNVNGGTPPYQYNWNSGALPNSATLSNLNPGNYNLVVTDGNGCNQNASYIVSQPSALTATITNQNNVTCNGFFNGSISTNIQGGTLPYSLQWNNGATTANLNNIGQGNYSLTATDANGCLSTLSTTVLQPASPLSSTLTSTLVSCFGGNNGFASVNVVGGTAPYSYSWNAFPTQNTASISNLAANNYNVIITDANGCTTNNSVDITQPNVLTLNLNNQQNITCNGLSNASIAVGVSGGTQPYQYTWNGGTLPNTSTLSNLNAGNYSLIVTDAKGCSQNSSYLVTSPSALTSVIANQNNISCPGAMNGSILTNVQGGTPPYTYLWSNGATSANLYNLVQGNYTLIVKDINSCYASLTTSITQPQPITTTINGTSLVCPGENITLTANSMGGVGNMNYFWSNGSTGNTAVISTNVNASFQVYGVDVNGCQGPTVSKAITVNDIRLASLNVFGDSSICIGEMAEIYAIFKPGLGTYTYNWSNGLGTGLIPMGITPTTNTNYAITVTDNCGNTLDNGILVQVHPLPEVALTPQNAIGCGEASFNFQNDFANTPGSTYNWSFGDNTFSTSQTPIKNYNQSASYPVMLIVTTSFGCTELSTTTVNAIVNPVAIASFDFSPNDELEVNNATLRFTNHSTNTTAYKWTFGDGDVSTIAEPVHTYKDAGNYEIVLITNNTYNCNDTLIKEIIVKPSYNFYIPNAFTPDNNGVNEVFTAVGEEIKEFNMQIFNRWGEVIFETQELERGWDGKAKNGSEIAQEGVYVYNIKLKDFTGRMHSMQGKVTLIK